MKLRGVALGLLLVSAAQADDGRRRLVFQTVPSAVVAVAESPTGNQTFTGSPVELDLATFPGQDPLVFWLRQNGYEPLRVEVPVKELRPGQLNHVPNRPGSRLELPPHIVPVTFQTSPTGARIYLRGLDNRLTALEQPSGQENDLNLARLLGAGQQSQLTVVFECPFYHNATFPVSIGAGEVPARLPEQGSFPLSPRLPGLSPLALALQRTGHPWLAGGALAGLLGLAGAAGWARLRRRQPETPTVAVGPLVIPRYAIQEKIGSGGMSDVYRALSESGESVAIKVLKVEQQAESDLRRFQREIQISKDLAHANLVRLYDWGEVGGRLYLVMELLEGQTLRERLRDGRLTHEETARVLEDVASALLALHQKGIIHRDLKPENIFLSGGGKVKLMDYGIALSHEHTQITTTGVFLGTPAYVAPEQVQGKAEFASDQYALGILAFEMLTGTRPFDEPDALALAYSQVNKTPPRPSSRLPELSAEVDEAVLRMLDKRPSARHPDVLSAVRALRTALGLAAGDDEQKTGAW